MDPNVNETLIHILIKYLQSLVTENSQLLALHLMNGNIENSQLSSLHLMKMLCRFQKEEWTP